jgi:hypothetical protein
MSRFALGAALASLLSSLLACGDDGDVSQTGGTAGGGGTGGSAAGGGGLGGGGGSDGGNGGDGAKAGGGPCPSGVTCFEAFPYYGEGDTSVEGATRFDAYACAPETDESGPELVFRATVPTDGFLSALVRDGDGVDIDVHILGTLDPEDCLERGDVFARADVPQGDVWIVADTWVNASGTAQAGAFEIEIGFVPASSGACDVLSGEMPRIGDGGDSLAMPATGPIALLPHLVTADEPAPFPSSASEELDEHYLLSQDGTGLVMPRAAGWAPLTGGATFFGAGVGDPADLPVAHEAYYVSMLWTPAARPPPGTRMILRSPSDPERAVVAAAGYATGPESLAQVGGTTEEVHLYLGTSHLAELELGIAEDQTLPIGPRRCDLSL